jgi:hypothetical protein
MAVLTPMMLAVFFNLKTPDFFLMAWSSNDVLRELWQPYSFDFLGSMTCFLDKVISPEPHMLGALLAAMSMVAQVVLPSRSARLWAAGLTLWGTAFIYTPQFVVAGIGLGMSLYRDLIFARVRQNDWSWERWLPLLAVLAVTAFSGAYGMSLQSSESVAATLRVLGGHPISLHAPHLPNLLTPLGLLGLVVLFCAPLVRIRLRKAERQTYLFGLCVLTATVLFLRLPAGLNYKWSFVIPVLFLPAVASVLLGVLHNMRQVRWVWVYLVGLVFLPWGVDTMLRLRSKWYGMTIYPVETRGDVQSKYYTSLKPALLWIREHTPLNAYILIYPWEPGGERSTAVENFSAPFLAHRRMTYLGDALYTAPMTGSARVKEAVLAVFGANQTRRQQALGMFCGREAVFVVSVPPHIIPADARGRLRLVWRSGECEVLEILRGELVRDQNGGCSTSEP